MAEYIDFCFGLTESKDIVKALKAHPVKKISRGYFPSTLDSCNNRYIKDEINYSKSDIFNIIPGTVLIHLENDDIIGFDIDDIKDSIVVWFDVRQSIEYDTQYHIRELCEYMMHDHSEYSHKNNWDHIIGHKITKISVIEYDRGGKRYYDDSFQKAIVLETGKGDMVLSYLPDSPFPFSLIRKSQMPQEILDNSKIIEL